MSEVTEELKKLLAPDGSPIVERQQRVLIYDIERLPGLARVWEPKTRYVPAHDFVEWPSLLCFAARWYGQRKPIFQALWSEGGKDEMVAQMWALMNEADTIVTYNGVKFDNKHMRSLFVEAGYPPPRPFKDVDLYKIVQQFGWESKSLDSVTRRLGRPGKEMRYDKDLARAASEGDERAQRKMRRYNIGDIELTEWLYDRLRGWMPSHPHLGTWGDNIRCNQCGSSELIRQSAPYRAVVIDYALYRCTDCGANIRGGWYSREAATRGVK